MQDFPLRRPRLWIIAGTGEGPLLAAALLQRGWRLRVQVVSAEARRAYAPDPQLEVVVGALAGPEAVRETIAQARRAGDPFAWLVDASHPFALRISATLVEACRGCGQPLLRLLRPLEAEGAADRLVDGSALAASLEGGERLLLAVGARHLASLLAPLPAVQAHARVLPRPLALRQARAAGLPPERIACLAPTADGRIEAALCRQWAIHTVLCRESGGHTERLWRRLCAAAGLRLLLLARPAEPPGVETLPLPALLDRLAAPGDPAAWGAPQPQADG
ncbi:MAG: precorrin-6A/cobalt-precorrin-6A reductase [Cyanobacteriota bacterium]|nr:precorrin-6A/cobalt-precorrin-6A reductase [Cyanobacteriota bacterium]